MSILQRRIHPPTSLPSTSMLLSNLMRFSKPSFTPIPAIRPTFCLSCSKLIQAASWLATWQKNPFVRSLSAVQKERGSSWVLLTQAESLSLREELGFFLLVIYSIFSIRSSWLASALLFESKCLRLVLCSNKILLKGLNFSYWLLSIASTTFMISHGSSYNF